MAAGSTYARQWQNYRCRRRWFRLVFFATTALWLGGGQTLFPRLFFSEHSTKVVGIALFSALGVSGFYLYHWRCPRCQWWFFRGWFGVHPFARHCVHCGLPKWSLGLTAQSPTTRAGEQRRGVLPFSARAFRRRR